MDRLSAGAVLVFALYPILAPFSVARDHDLDKKDHDLDRKDYDLDRKDYDLDKRPTHHTTNAAEMTVMGLGSAVVIAGAGYLALRRHTRTAE